MDTSCSMVRNPDSKQHSERRHSDIGQSSSLLTQLASFGGLEEFPNYPERKDGEPNIKCIQSPSLVT